MPEDERERQIAGIAELAANAYAAVGPEGLYDYLAPDVQEGCSLQELENALKEEPAPDGYRRVEAVQADGDEARATVVQVYGEEERSSEWTFVSVDDSWRIKHVPGLERCAE